jgi:hypothetical protein
MDYQSEKQTIENPRSYQFFVRWLFLIFGSITMLIFIWAIGFYLWLSAGSVKSSLDTQYIPTAEYLLENPVEEPSSDWLGFNIILNNIEQDKQEICFAITGSSDEDFDRASYVT